MGRKSGIRIIVAGMASLPESARRAALYREAVERAFATSKRRFRGEVNVIFLGRAEMLRMNRHYLGHDYDTDVITFEHDRTPGVPGDEHPIGDIIVSSWMTRRQAREIGHSVAEEAATLVAHGALHLLGHDDHSEKDRKRMFKVQNRVVASLSA